MLATRINAHYDPDIKNKMADEKHEQKPWKRLITPVYLAEGMACELAAFRIISPVRQQIMRITHF